MDNQSLTNTGGQGLNQTGNPQTIPTQNLGASSNELQSGNTKQLYDSGVNITSVGSQEFIAVDQNIQIPSTDTSTKNETSSTAPVIFGFLLVVIILTGLVLLAIKRSKPQKPKQAQTAPPKPKTKSKKSRAKRKAKPSK